jgi:hypothetical protein
MIYKFRWKHFFGVVIVFLCLAAISSLISGNADRYFFGVALPTMAIIFLVLAILVYILHTIVKSKGKK